MQTFADVSKFLYNENMDISYLFNRCDVTLTGLTFARIYFCEFGLSKIFARIYFRETDLDIKQKISKENKKTVFFNVINM